MSCWSYHAQRHTRVKRNLCALMSQKWYEIAVWNHLGCQKACSKGAIQYETAETGSRSSGENVEKTGHFMMKKLRLCMVCSGQKKRLARATQNRVVSGGAQLCQTLKYH